MAYRKTICRWCKKEFGQEYVIRPFLYCVECRTRTCKYCGNNFLITGDRVKLIVSYCSISCCKKDNPINQSKIKRNYGKDHPRWKGGKVLRKDGYVLIEVMGKRFFEHRYIMEKHLGRKLDTSETIHHINHDRSDNRIDNLELINRSEHTRKYHMKGKHF